MIEKTDGVAYVSDNPPTHSILQLTRPSPRSLRRVGSATRDYAVFRRRKPGKDVPTIVEVNKNLFLLRLQGKFVLAKAEESINK